MQLKIILLFMGEFLFLLFQIIYGKQVISSHIQTTLVDAAILSQIAVVILTLTLTILVALIYNINMGVVKAIESSKMTVSFSLGGAALAFGLWQIISSVILVVLLIPQASQ